LQDIKTYFQLLAKSKYPVTLPAKVMFLGNHAAGKTSFWYFFQTGKLPDTKMQSTEILSIHPYPENTLDNLPEAMIYDFGGQDYYHGLYRAFFSEDSIVVLMWCNSSDKNKIHEKSKDGIPTRDFTRSFWLHQLPYYTKIRKSDGKEPIILVQTHKDIEINQIPNVYKDDKSIFYIINQYFVSLINQDDPEENKLNLDDLKQLKSRLLQEINKKRKEEKKPMYYETFLKNVLKTKGKDYTDINKLLVKGKQTLDELKYELNQMHLRGLVMYYRDTMPEIVWTDPEATVRHIHDDILSKTTTGKVEKNIFETEICRDEKIRKLIIEEKVIFHDRSNENNIRYFIPMVLPLWEKDENFKYIKSRFTKPNYILKFNHFIPFGLINQLICLFGVHRDDEKLFWRDQLMFIFNQQYDIRIVLDFEKLEIAVYIRKLDDINIPSLSLPDMEKLIFINIIDLYNGKDIKYYWKKNNELTQLAATRC